MPQLDFFIFFDESFSTCIFFFFFFLLILFVWLPSIFKYKFVLKFMYKFWEFSFLIACLYVWFGVNCFKRLKQK